MGIVYNVTEQAMEEAMNTVVYIPLITNGMTGMGGTQDNITNSMQNGTFMQ